MQAYQLHMTSAHRWYCVACEHRNFGAAFPLCALCGNKFGAGEGEQGSKGEGCSMMKAFKENVKRMKLSLDVFMKREGAQQKDNVSGFHLSNRLTGLAIAARENELIRLREEQSDWEALLEIRYDEKAEEVLSKKRQVALPPLAAPAEAVSPLKRPPHRGIILADLAPLETLLTVSCQEVHEGNIPAPAFDAIVRPRQQHTLSSTTLGQQRSFREELSGQPLEEEGLLLPKGGLFVCEGFVAGFCTLSTCPLAHPGIRDSAKSEYFSPESKPDKKRRNRRAYVQVCEDALIGKCAHSATHSCERYHMYVRPETVDIIRQIYPITAGMKQRVFPGRDVEYTGSVTKQGFHGFGVMTWKTNATYAGYFQLILCLPLK